MKKKFLLFLLILNILCFTPIISHNNAFDSNINSVYCNKIKNLSLNGTENIDGGYGSINLDEDYGESADNVSKFINDDDEKNIIDAFNGLLNRYRVAIMGVFGFVTMSLLIVFIVLFMKLGANSSNPMERKKILDSILRAGIATAIMGSVTTVYGLLFFAMK